MLKLDRRLLVATVASLTLMAPASPSSAEDTFSGEWTLGVAQMPDYEGSEDSQIMPLAGFALDIGGYAVELQGTSLRVDLLASPVLDAGAVFNYRFGRDDVENASVAALPDIDATVEVGMFSAATLPLATGAVKVSGEVLVDAGGVHDGVFGTFTLGYGSVLSERLRVGVAASVSTASGGYAQTYFGVAPDAAARSGLDAYSPDGGFKDVGLDFSVTYDLTPQIAMTGLVSYRRLVGEFADSPIVQAGSPDQLTFGLSLTRSF